MLSRGIVFKGGNALRFAYGGTRSTIDLDFTAKEGVLEDDPDDIRRQFDRAFKPSPVLYRVRIRCQRIKRNPKDMDKTTPTYDVRVGYQFQGDRYYESMEHKNVSDTIPVEVSFNDLVCEEKPFVPQMGNVASMLVCSLEDILAEKLRALLQQPIRRRNRSQDVYDLAAFLRDRATELDFEKIFTFLVLKCQVRGMRCTREDFDTTVRDMASLSYEVDMRRQTGNDFIPFNQAWEEVIGLVDQMPRDSSK